MYKINENTYINLRQITSVKIYQNSGSIIEYGIPENMWCLKILMDGDKHILTFATEEECNKAFTDLQNAFEQANNRAAIIG